MKRSGMLGLVLSVAFVCAACGSSGNGNSASGSGGSSSGKVYDIFGYDNSGTATMTFVAWTNTTTRATALAYDSDGGFLVESGTSANRYLGSIYITASGESEDTTGDRALFCYDNRVQRLLEAYIPESSWSYSSSTWRACDSNTTNGEGRCSVLTGVAEEAIQVQYSTYVSYSTAATVAQIGLALNSTSSPNLMKTQVSEGSESAGGVSGITSATLQPAVGYSYIQSIESASASTTYTGDTASVTGITGSVHD